MFGRPSAGAPPHLPSEGAPAAAESPYWSLPDGPAAGAKSSGIAASTTAPQSGYADASGADPSTSSQARGPRNFFRRWSKPTEGYTGLASSAEQPVVGNAAGIAPARASTTTALSSALAAITSEGDGVSQRCWVAQKFDGLSRAAPRETQASGLSLDHKLQESLLDRPPPRQPLQDLSSFLAGSVPGLGRNACSQDVYQFLADEDPTGERGARAAYDVGAQFERLAPESTAAPSPPPPPPPGAPPPDAAGEQQQQKRDLHPS